MTPRDATHLGIQIKERQHLIEKKVPKSEFFLKEEGVQVDLIYRNINKMILIKVYVTVINAFCQKT